VHILWLKTELLHPVDKGGRIRTYNMLRALRREHRVTYLTLDDGTLALVSNGRYNGRGYDVRLEVHGSEDSVAVGLDQALPLRSVEAGTSFPAGPPHAAFMQRFLPAYRAELAAFTEVVAGLRPSPCTVADALEAEYVAEACSRSLREHRPVRTEEVR